MLSSLHRFSIRRVPNFTNVALKCTSFCTASSEHQSEEDENGEPDRTTKTVLSAVLHPEVLEKFNKRELSYFKHEGIRREACFRLPALNELGAKRAVSKFLNQDFRDRVERHRRGFDLIQLPDEVEDVKDREKFINSKLDHQIPMSNKMDPDEYEYVKNMREKKFHNLMNKYKPTWWEISYDEEKAAIYLASRFVPNYASLRWVLMDLAKSDPNFVPKTLFDFGSGIGTTMWAANSIWPNQIHEHMNIDISKPMNELCDFLLRDGDEHRPQLFPGVYFREYLPVSSTIKYDLVVSAFTLLELPSRKARIQAIEALWNKTQDTMIIIERGTRYGFTTVLEARNYVLQEAGYDVNKSYYNYDPEASDVQPLDAYNLPGAYVQGPCPHHFACPRLHTGGPVLCNFNVRYFPLNIGQTNIVSRDTNFSYVILRKGKKTLDGPSNWPRIVQQVKRRDKHVICRFCSPDGSIKSITFTKTKHKGDMYKVAKHSTWGDLLPVTIIETEKVLGNWALYKLKTREEKAQAQSKNDTSHESE